MHKVFISYHHANDQWYKKRLVDIGKSHDIFIDRSVDTGNVSDDLSDQQIRETIRDRYLRDSTVTIVLAGAETARRKHVDWEIYSSMRDGKVNKKSGILVITLPEIEASCDLIHAPHGQEEINLYPGARGWEPRGTRKAYRKACPSMPNRIIDNLVYAEAKVSVTPWRMVEESPYLLRALIELAFRDRGTCKYDLSRRMRRRNS